MQFSTAQSSLSLLHILFFHTLSSFGLSALRVIISSSLTHPSPTFFSPALLDKSMSPLSSHQLSPLTLLSFLCLLGLIRCSETGALFNNEPKYGFIINAQHLMMFSLPVRLSVE